MKPDTSNKDAEFWAGDVTHFVKMAFLARPSPAFDTTKYQVWWYTPIIPAFRRR